jgi:hypothetical protein
VKATCMTRRLRGAFAAVRDAATAERRCIRCSASVKETVTGPDRSAMGSSVPPARRHAETSAT